MRRGANVHVLGEADKPFIWAAYIKGTFPDIAKDLTAEGLWEELSGRFEGASEFHVLSAPVAERKGLVDPVGMVITLTKGFKTYPQALWFPWATKRNKLEATVKWFQEARQVRNPIIHVTDKDRPFFEHVRKYGVMRGIGLVMNYFAPGVNAWAYQGVFNGRI